MSSACATLAVCASSWLLLGFTVDANSNGEPYRWPNAAANVQIVSGSNEVSDGSDIRAIQHSLQTWSTVEGSAFVFVEVSAAPQVEVNFVSSDWPGYLDGALGVTVRERNGATYVSGSVELNDQDFPFGTIGEPNVYDIESVAVHELGHVLGLEHTPHPAATMHFRGGRTHTFFRNLEDDDVAGVRYLYPAGAFSCGADSDCPVFMVNRGASTINTYCSGGSCTAGSTDYGHACYVDPDDDDCNGNLCVYHPDVPGAPATVPNPGFCTTACDGTTCPVGSFCSDVPALGIGPVCFIGAEDCVQDSDCPESMGANAVCDRDLDGWFRCVIFCNEQSDCAVIPGASCMGYDSMTAGRCRVPGSKTQGALCEHGLECQSLVCGGGTPSYCCEGSNCTPSTSSDAGPVDTDGGPMVSDGGLTGDAPKDRADSSDDAIVGGCAAISLQPSSVWILGLVMRRWRQRRQG